MAGSVIDSFLVALGFQTDTKGAEDYKRSLESVETTLATVTGVAAAAAAAVGWVVHKAAESMGELYMFAQINGQSAVAMDTLGKMAMATGSNLEAVKSSIQGLNSVMGEAKLGVGRGAQVFEKLGLSATDAAGQMKTTDAMLEEIAGKMQGMSRQEQLAYLGKLRIDPSMIMMLKDGPEAFRKMREDFGGMSIFKEEDYKMAEEVDKLFKRASATVGVFAKQISVALFPVIKQILEAYLKWFKAQRQATSDVFAKAIKFLVAAIQTLFDWVVRLVTGIINVVNWLKKFELVTWLAAAALLAFVSIKTYGFVQNLISGLIGLTRAMLGFSASAMLIPAIIGAIIIALVALIDDFVNFKEGNDSLIGDLVKEYPQLLDVINAISDGVTAVINYFVGLFDTIKPALMDLGGALSHLFTALWPIIVNVMKGIGVVIAALLPVILFILTKVAQVITGLVEFLVMAISGAVEAIAMIIEGIATAVEAVTNFFIAVWQASVAIVSSIIEGLVNIFTGAWDAIKNGFVAVFDWLVGKFTAVVDKIKGAIGWVGKLLGISSGADAAADVATNTAVKSVSMAAQAKAYDGGLNPMADNGMSSPLTRTGGLGAAAQPSVNAPQTNTYQTNVTVPSIVVNSPDPAKAGENVRDELNKANRSAVRNGQSAVAL